MVQGIAGEEVSTLDSLCLRRIVKENHGTAIVQACFPPLPTSPNTMIDMTNILATVSASQVNLYDNEHCGDHLDILSTFECSSSKVILLSNKADHYIQKYMNKLLCVCWAQQSDDAYICTGGTDQMIRVLSMAKSTEVKQLKGHTGTIVGLACHPMDSNIILSLSEDGTARLWHLEAAKYLVVFSSQGSVAVRFPFSVNWTYFNL